MKRIEDINKFIEDYKRIRSCREIAKIYGVSPSRVSRIVKKHGLSVKNRVYKITDAEVRSLYNLYLCGMTIRQIIRTRNVKVGHQSLARRFRKLNLKIRKKKADFVVYDGKKFGYNKSMNQYRLTCGNREVLHRYIWIKHNGHVENDHYIVPIDGDKKTTDINNLKSVPKIDYSKNNLVYRGGKVGKVISPIKCKFCNKVIPVNGLCYAIYSKRVFCNSVCRGEWFTGKPKGTSVLDIRRAKSYIKGTFGSKGLV